MAEEKKPDRIVSEITVFVNGQPVLTCPDERTAGFEAQHQYSLHRIAGNPPPTITYKRRTVNHDARPGDAVTEEDIAV
jgi:hypothetical protein